MIDHQLSSRTKKVLRRYWPALAFSSLALALAAGWTVCADEFRANAKSAVLSVHEFELKGGVKPEEFEAFVKKEVSQELSVEKTGTRMRVFRGDRGDRKGRYILVWEFESVAVRNAWFPREGFGSSAAYDRAWKRIKISLEKFTAFVHEKNSYTDYVAVTE